MPAASPRITKHHGLGNDFVVVVDPDGTHPVDAALARALCDRHTGIGADGIMRATPGRARSADERERHARMELRNADGSAAEMSGNGIRCFVQALLLTGEWSGSEVTVETDAGLRTVTVHEQVDAVTHSLSVAMGAARVGDEVPEWAGGDVARAVLVDVGNPHLVLDMSAAGPTAAEDVDLVALGETVNAKVSGGSNVHLLTTGDDGAVAIRIYERGVGPTQACGTGACAAAAAARRWGLAGDVVPVDMPGGRAEVRLGASEADAIVLRGPATYVGAVELGASPWR
jgi:diaminopimelate epimerase